ncbi:unnamed protein product [Euphydryas editha]|uniref:Major facilitator superfamily (MFS) profile domain-containing protein n=1 Tax=Euphydryas editha TaxID=104508 RepID=A0AAU9UJP6_EUPED|nr:unnamed protein product [Euphydryas editha]
MTVGILYTWPSSTLVLFTSPNTTLNRVMTETEISFLGSLSSISGIIVTPFSGVIMDSLGRKWSCIVFNLALLASWVIITTCTMVEAILFAMFVFGLSSCMFIVLPIYVGEFCDNLIRGSMMSASMIFYGIGMLVSYLMGGLLDYKTMNYVGLSLTVLGLVLFSAMKESPLHLLKIGREREAAKSIAFYRSLKITSKEVKEEIEKLSRILNTDIVETPIEEKLELNIQEAPPTKRSQWQYLRKSHTAQRGLLVCIVLFTASIFQGLMVVQVYAEPLFQKAMPSISSTVASVLFALVCIVAGVVASYLIDMIGRRPLMIYGSLATGLSCVILGSQIQLNWGPNWLTAVLIYLYCVTYTVGAGTIPFVIAPEVFMPEVKSLASMIAMEWAFACMFVVLFIFNPLVNSLGLGAVFYIFAISCFLSTVFCFYYLPETKGLAVDEIQERLKRPR